jgi:hypothetical protein
VGSFHAIVSSFIRDAVTPSIERGRPAVLRHAARLSAFAVVFRAQADQARRLDAIDATLGAVLGMLLIILPLALTTARDLDEVLAASIFAIPIGTVSRALFFLGGEVPNGVYVSRQFVRDFFRGGSKATRTLTQVFEDDYVILNRKKTLLRAAYLSTVLIASGNAVLHGGDLDHYRRGVVYSFPEDNDASLDRGGPENARPANG